MSDTNKYREGPNGGISRAFFRSLIDPLLDGLGLKAEQVASCRFDGYGFEVVLFQLNEQGRRVHVSSVALPNVDGGVSHHNGSLKATVRIPIDDWPRDADEKAN